MTGSDKRASFSAKTQKRLFRLVVALALVSFCLCLFFISQHLSYRKDLVEQTKAAAVNSTVEGAKELDGAFRWYMVRADRLADDLTAGRVVRGAEADRMRAIVDGHPDVHGIAIAYTPQAHGGKAKLYAPYYSRRHGKPQFSRIESEYDYTKEEQEWYQLPLEHGATWIEPYFGAAGAVLMTTYAVPFFKIDPETKKKAAIGVVAIDISLDEVRKIVSGIDLGQGGYGAVVSKKGAYLYHPTRQYVEGLRSILDVARETKDPDRLVASEKSLKGERGVMDHRSVTTGLDSWYIYEPVPATGWSLHATFVKEEVPIDFNGFRRQMIRIAASTAFFLLTVLLLLCRIYQGDNGHLWMASAVMSLILCIAIGMTWHIALTWDPDMKSDGKKILGKTDVAHFVSVHDKMSAQRQWGEATYVPTGLFVHNIEFTGANKIAVTGYIWQKYSLRTAERVRRGFIFPDATADVKTAQVYSFADKDHEVLGWYFSTVLYQQCDYTHYPIDFEALHIRIGPKEIGGNVVFIPDVDGYKLITPSALPGLEKGFHIPDWQIRSTFFEMRSSAYDTTFGIERFFGQEGFPELAYHIMVRRNLVDAIIRNMTAIFVVALLLFAVMFLMTEEKMSKKFAMDIGENLVFIGSMFFVVIYSHISTRGRIPTQEIFYLEYYYFLMYLALLWIPVSAMLFVEQSKSFFISYRDNYMSKILYWPVLLGIMFIITTVTLY
jgi:hypothetical protein